MQEKGFGRGMADKNTSKQVETKLSLSPLLPFVFQHFRLAYIGIFAPHVWIFCIIHRSGVDYGSLPIAIPLYVMLSLCMALAVAITLRTHTQRLPRMFDWLAVVILVAATIILVYPLPISGRPLAFMGSLLAGAGMALLYLQWAPFYAALDIKNAIACIFGAMAAGSALKIFIDLMPPLPATLCMIILPLFSIIWARQALAYQPARESKTHIIADEGTWPIPLKIMVGVATYSIIIGVMQALPLPFAPVSPEFLTLLHHGAEIIVAALVLYWVFVRRGLLRFSSLWQAILLFTATGLLILPLIGPQWTSSALVFVSIAQTLVVMLFWVMLADIAHHSTRNPLVIFGSGWIVYAAFFALGEAIGKAVGDQGVGMYALTVMTYFLTLAAVFSLNERNFSQRRIFADLDTPLPEKSNYASIDADCMRLGSAHGLTDREVEILQLICKGRLKNYIAETLIISENTVRSHAKHIYQKLDVHSKQELLDMLER